MSAQTEITENIAAGIDTFMNMLNDAGYAVAIFAPDELKGAPIHKVEEAMIERGFDMIDTLGHEDDIDADDFCINCDGTGEGQYDGAACVICKGSGVTHHASV